jgi:AsmA protein
VLTGTGTISPAGALDYKMTANLSGSVVTGLTQLAGLGNKGAAVAFFIRGTTANPSFVPDVQGTLNSTLKSRLQGIQGQNQDTNSVVDKLSGLFHRKKK